MDSLGWLDFPRGLGQRGGMVAAWICRWRRVPVWGLLCLMAACAPDGVGPVFSAAPSYPETSVRVAAGTWEHRTDGGDAAWQLVDGSGRVLLTVPSFLSDPELAGPEFAAYHRAHDRAEVWESATGNTVLLMEDRSPNYPDRRYMVARRDAAGNWSWRTPGLGPYRTARGRELVDLAYPEILGLSDEAIRCTGPEGEQRVELK